MTLEKTVINCRKCEKPFRSIRAHLAKKDSCKAFYTEDQLEELINEYKRRHQASKNHSQIKHYDKQKKSEVNQKYYKDNSSQVKQRINENYQLNEKSLSKFYEECKYGPIFPCICCKRCLSLRGVRTLKDPFLKFLQDNDIDTNIDLNNALRVNGNFHLCHTCHSNLSKKKMPNLCFMNELKLADIPECLQISSLGNQLLAKHLIFLKIRHLPKTGMEKNNDRVSYFPIFHSFNEDDY